MVPAVRRRPTRIPSLLSSTQPFSKERSEVRSIMGRSLLIAPERPSPRCLVTGEGLSGAISNDRPIIDRTSDRSFENGCVDESRLGMRVGRRRPAGTIFDEHTLDTFARHIWQSVLVNERDLCIFVSRYP